jgi:aspartate/methionine/tyrosine aminotransferase
MKIAPFALERYFAKHEFSARHLLSCSDCEALTLDELTGYADEETRALWSDLKLSYTETAGHPLLRESIADIYSQIQASDILVAVPEELIFLLMHTLLKPGDHVVCIAPAYQSLHEIARSIGCEVSDWIPEETDGWRFDVNHLESLLRPETRLIVVNFPHNPTGHVPSRADFEAIIDVAKRHDVYLLSDEMYRFLELQPDTNLPSACESYDRAFSLFGLSKSFGLPGLRVGWMASKSQDILEGMSSLKDYTTICNSAPAEILAIMAVRAREAIFHRHITRVSANLAIFNEFLGKYPDLISMTSPIGGSIGLPRMLIDTDTSEFCDRLVAESGIMLVPSALFGFGENHVRIGFGRDNFPEVIDRFGDYLTQTFR